MYFILSLLNMARYVFLSCFLHELWLFCFFPGTNGTELYIPSCSNKDVRETCWLCVVVFFFLFVCSLQVKNTHTHYVEFPGWKRTCENIFNCWSYVLRICPKFLDIGNNVLCNTKIYYVIQWGYHDLHLQGNQASLFSWSVLNFMIALSIRQCDKYK